MCGAGPTRADIAGTLATLLDEGFERPSRPVEYRIAGQALRVHYSDAALPAALSPALDHLRAPASSPEGLDLFVRVGAPVPPGGTARGETRPRIHFAEGPIRGVMYPATGISGLLDAERRRAVWWLPDPSRIPVSERSGPFRTILQWWLSRHDLQIAHAGAVGAHGGAALLVGRGGSGKSVTSVACAAGCLRFLGDDSVLCSTDPVPTAHCLYACATVHREDAARFPGLAAVPSAGEKVLLDLSGHVARSLPLKALLVPRVTGRPKTRVSPISATDTLRAMAPSSLLNLPGSGEEAFARLAELARRLPGYAIELGTDIAEIPRVLAGLLEGRDPR